MQAAKRIIITFFSIISILFGLAGTVISFGGIFVLNSYQESFDNINQLSFSVAGAIEETSEMLKNSNNSSQHIADSIRITEDSINNASEITYDSGMAFNEIAGVIGFEILGFKPLEGAEDYFEDIGNNLISLSRDLDTAENSLGVNASDIERIGNDLENISVELQEVHRRFDQAIKSFSIYNLVMVIKYILVYSGILSIMFVLNGIMFLSLRR